MDFNRCSRCGSFFVSNNDVCPKCQSKDSLEFETFKNYIAQNGVNQNLDVLSSETGISVKNINRFLNYTDNNFNGNVNIEL